MKLYDKRLANDLCEVTSERILGTDWVTIDRDDGQQGDQMLFSGFGYNSVYICFNLIVLTDL